MFVFSPQSCSRPTDEPCGHLCAASVAHSTVAPLRAAFLSNSPRLYVIRCFSEDISYRRVSLVSFVCSFALFKQINDDNNNTAALFFSSYEAAKHKLGSESPLSQMAAASIGETVSVSLRCLWVLFGMSPDYNCLKKAMCT